MFEIMMTDFGLLLGQFISSMIVNNEASGYYKFKTNSNNNSGISYNAKLDPYKRNLHVTIDLDFNF